MGRTIPRWGWGAKLYRKEVEGEPESEPVSRVPAWSQLQFLPLVSALLSSLRDGI